MTLKKFFSADIAKLSTANFSILFSKSSEWSKDDWNQVVFSIRYPFV